MPGATASAGGQDFFLADFPEREDPGNSAFDTARIPMVIGADGPSRGAWPGALRRGDGHDRDGAVRGDRRAGKLTDDVVARSALESDRPAGRGLNDPIVPVVGVAYKKNIDDLRESPPLEASASTTMWSITDGWPPRSR